MGTSETSSSMFSPMIQTKCKLILIRLTSQQSLPVPERHVCHVALKYVWTECIHTSSMEMPLLRVNYHGKYYVLRENALRRLEHANFSATWFRINHNSQHVIRDSALIFSNLLLYDMLIIIITEVPLWHNWCITFLILIFLTDN